MSQVFHPRFGLFVKLLLLGLLLGASAAVLAWRGWTAGPHRLDEHVEQPVPFSHQHHVGQVGLDCRYCHDSVENEAFAGIPAVSVCMTCHSQLFTDQPMLQPVVDSWRRGVAQLKWARVNDLPDFVYFNHSIHVAKGVGCVSCHGRVDTMPLTARVKPLSMQWCLDCHRNPAPNLRPKDKVFAMDWHPQHPKQLAMDLVKRYHILPPARLSDCSICHR